MGYNKCDYRLNQKGDADVEQAIPVIVICSVGMAACLGYIVYAFVKWSRRKLGKRNTFEIDEDSLTIKLGKKK